MIKITTLGRFTVSQEKVRRVLLEHDEEVQAKLLPAFYLQFAKYRYSLREEYAYALGQHLQVDFRNLKLSIGYTDASQTKGIHKCIGVCVPPNVRDETVRTLREAIDSKKVRDFMELHMVGTLDGPKTVSADVQSEMQWKDKVQKVAEKIQTMGPLVILHHSGASQKDAAHMRGVAVKFHHLPVVFDMQNDLATVLTDARVEVPTAVPQPIRRKMHTLVTPSAPEWYHSESSETIFRQSLLDYFYPGTFWNSAYFIHDGVCLGCRKQFDYLYQTGQIERMLKNPNRTMYGGLRYQRKNYFTRTKHLVGYKPSARLSNVTSLSKPLG